jgi:Tol biopolymer transport system component
LRWSPDGKRLRFSVYGGRGDEVDIWETAPDGSGAHTLRLSAKGRQCCGEWTPDGRYYIYTAFVNAVQNLWAVRERGAGIHWGAKQPVQITSGAISIYDGLPVSNDRMFTYVEATAYESVHLNVKTHELTPYLPGKQILSLSYSPDGKRLAYQMFPDNSLWQAKADGTDEVEIVGPPLQASKPQWSPDGTTIAFETYVRGKGMRSYLIKAEGGPPEPVLARDVQQSLPVWSPDGRSLAVAVNVLARDAPTADRGIFIVEPRTHAATKMEDSDGLTCPIWSPDGKSFIARTPDHHDILLWDSNKKVWTKILSGRQLAGPFWSNDSKYLYYQDVLQPGQPIYRLATANMKRDLIFGFDEILAGGIRKALIQAVAPDGSLIISLMRAGVRVHAMEMNLP